VPSEEELAADRSSRRQQLEADKQNQALEIWLNETRRELEQSGRLRVNAELALGA